MLAQDIGEDSEEETFGKFSSNFDAFGRIRRSMIPLHPLLLQMVMQIAMEIIPTVLPRVHRKSQTCVRQQQSQTMNKSCSNK